MAFDAADATHGLSVDKLGTLHVHPLAIDAQDAGLDLTRRTLECPESTGSPIGLRSLDERARERVSALAMTVISADQLGLMDRALTVAVAYAKERRQFGRVIGANQALAHVLADAAVLVEASRSCVWHAAWALDSHGEADVAAALEAARQAKAFCGLAAREVLEAAVQVHGGIAITWEHVVPLMLRRVLFDAELFGAPRTQYEPRWRSGRRRRTLGPGVRRERGAELCRFAGGGGFSRAPAERGSREHAPADPPAP